jgi:hypothetical protein
MLSSCPGTTRATVARLLRELIVAADQAGPVAFVVYVFGGRVFVMRIDHGGVCLCDSKNAGKVALPGV